MWKRVRAWLLFFSVVLGLVLSFFYVFLSLTAATLPDYGRRPPERVFAMLLGYPPPRGVNNLRAEGKAALFGPNTIWVTFNFTDAAFARMWRRGSSQPITGDVARATIPQYGHPRSRQAVARMHRVGWDEVARIRNPELYSDLPTANSRWTGWVGWCVLDRERHRAYLQAEN